MLVCTKNIWLKCLEQEDGGFDAAEIDRELIASRLAKDVVRELESAEGRMNLLGISTNI